MKTGMSFSNVLLLATLAFFVSELAAEETQTVLFTAQYQGKYSGMTIKSTRKLSLGQDGRFRIESKIKNFMASIEERGDFSLQNGVMQPHFYHYKRKIMAFKADEKLRFDWQKKIAEYRRKDKPEKNRDHPIELGLLDPVLYQLQLQRDAYSGLEKFSFTFVKPSKVKTLLFHKTAEEELTVGETPYSAIKIERINLDDDKETRIWLIPALNYQIAKIEHIEEDGQSYNIYLTDYSSHEKLIELIYKSNPASQQTPAIAKDRPALSG